ncbi:MAG: DUF3597 domain-containing protein [Proteobacteria bacterium]|nr:DUF3597 domain-containing protein [Pseudomonadota bacterium]
MSIFGSIMSKIFGSSHATSGSAPASADPASNGGSAAPAQTATASPQTPAQSVDVQAVLTQMASEKGGGGNWQTSIVDLLKLLGLDSSLTARKELANELNIHAGADGSAEQNIALQKAVMQQLAANGGKVPESLKA